MRKYLLLLLVVCAAWLKTDPAQSFLPQYDDDEEFRLCAKVSSWDTCAVEENHRHLKKVRQQYRSILGNPEILKWHAEPEANTQALREMYESWTAFKSRICSLSHASAKYMESLLEEKNSCNLYHTLHHSDHLNKLLLLINKKAPRKSDQFDFLVIYDHDDAYTQCREEKGETDCLPEEMKRTNQTIKDMYQTLLDSETVGKWNNGADLKQGNFRDMYDSWIAFRNRMCALSVWAYTNYYGPESITMTRCLQFFNREKFEFLTNIMIASNSVLDQEHLENEYGEQSDILDKDDGGAEEGRTITPLERRNGATAPTPEDTLVKEEKKEEPQPQAEPKPEEKYNIPAWAN
ncbi:MAG: DUF1311 domain-containing protein [Alphaproteobacteria bacterium]|nr:DUF1311 domain-containing protein [Alphaproteobacteria bacterium]